jgi:hypothetical protein
MDGISEDERQSYATLWAISCAPLYIGDDLDLLDPFGLSLLTNREVIDINQNGMPARPLTNEQQQEQVWWSQSGDGSYVVALFNLADTEATVTASWADLGFSGPATARDIWAGENLGSFNEEFTVQLPSHASRLLRVTKLDEYKIMRVV